jgi:hypothetical protein
MTYSILTPLTLIIAVLYLAIVFIDAFVIWMFTAKAGVNFWKALLGASLANITTAVFGLFIGFNSNNKSNLIWFLVAVIVNILIEWLIYIPIYKKNEVTKTKLFIISLISNVIVFTVLAFLFFYKTGILTQYFDLPFIQAG